MTENIISIHTTTNIPTKSSTIKENPKSQNKNLIHISIYLFLIEIEESIQKKNTKIKTTYIKKKHKKLWQIHTAPGPDLSKLSVGHFTLIINKSDILKHIALNVIKDRLLKIGNVHTVIVDG